MVTPMTARILVVDQNPEAIRNLLPAEPPPDLCHGWAQFHDLLEAKPAGRQLAVLGLVYFPGSLSQHDAVDIQTRQTLRPLLNYRDSVFVKELAAAVVIGPTDGPSPHDDIRTALRRLTDAAELDPLSKRRIYEGPDHYYPYEGLSILIRMRQYEWADALRQTGREPANWRPALLHWRRSTYIDASFVERVVQSFEGALGVPAAQRTLLFPWDLGGGTHLKSQIMALAA